MACDSGGWTWANGRAATKFDSGESSGSRVPGFSQKTPRVHQKWPPPCLPRILVRDAACCSRLYFVFAMHFLQVYLQASAEKSHAGPWVGGTLVTLSRSLAEVLFKMPANLKEKYKI